MMDVGTVGIFASMKLFEAVTFGCKISAIFDDGDDDDDDGESGVVMKWVFVGGDKNEGEEMLYMRGKLP